MFRLYHNNAIFQVKYRGLSLGEINGNRYLEKFVFKAEITQSINAIVAKFGRVLFSRAILAII